eukprot:scaffold53_cov193-Pinguiococcus_pyrenoidosus.AAC.41
MLRTSVALIAMLALSTRMGTRAFVASSWRRPASRLLCAPEAPAPSPAESKEVRRTSAEASVALIGSKLRLNFLDRHRRLRPTSTSASPTSESASLWRHGTMRIRTSSFARRLMLERYDEWKRRRSDHPRNGAHRRLNLLSGGASANRQRTSCPLSAARLGEQEMLGARLVIRHRLSEHTLFPLIESCLRLVLLTG